MATATPTPASTQAPARPADGDQRVEFLDIAWEGYEAILRVRGDRSRPQMIYLDGDLILLSPAHFHERLNDRPGTLVRVVVEELDIPCVPTRENTFFRREKEAGVQPDGSFYLANYGPIAAKDGQVNIDLRVDPPPDLVVEVVHTHGAAHAIEVLRRFGVPEVWACDPGGLSILALRGDGQYVEADVSLAFPFLAAAEVCDRVTRPGMASTTQWTKELRRWPGRCSSPASAAGASDGLSSGPTKHEKDRRIGRDDQVA